MLIDIKEDGGIEFKGVSFKRRWPDVPITIEVYENGAKIDNAILTESD